MLLFAEVCCKIKIVGILNQVVDVKFRTFSLTIKIVLHVYSIFTTSLPSCLLVSVYSLWTHEIFCEVYVQQTLFLIQKNIFLCGIHHQLEWDSAPGAAQYVCQEAGLQVPLLDEDPHWEEVFVTAGSSLCSRFPQPTHPTEWYIWEILHTHSLNAFCRNVFK